MIWMHFLGCHSVTSCVTINNIFVGSYLLRSLSATIRMLFLSIANSHYLFCTLPQTTNSWLLFFFHVLCLPWRRVHFLGCHCYFFCFIPINHLFVRSFPSRFHFRNKEDLATKISWMQSYTHFTHFHILSCSHNAANEWGFDNYITKRLHRRDIWVPYRSTHCLCKLPN